MKWVLGFPANNALGLPAIHGILLLNDAADRRPDRDPRRRADHGPAHGGDLGRRDPGLGAGGRRAADRARPSSGPASRAAATCR